MGPKGLVLYHLFASVGEFNPQHFSPRPTVNLVYNKEYFISK